MKAPFLVKASFERAVCSNPKKYIRLYKARFGKVLNTDKARELCPDYACSLRSRTLYSGATHEPASSIVKMVWREMLSSQELPGEPDVIFVAGGPGSGKTFTIAKSALLSQVCNSAQIIYDTTLSEAESAFRKIEEALVAGKYAYIFYIHRLVEDAAQSAFLRALKDGRIMPIDILARCHFDAQRTMLDICERYRGNDDVFIHLLDNTGHAEDPSLMVESDLRNALYSDMMDIRLRAMRGLRDGREQARRSGIRVPKAVLDGFRETGVTEAGADSLGEIR